MPNKTFVVLGCHRSGTSTISKMLCDLGVDMGVKGYSPGDKVDMKKEYFEDSRFSNLNDKILNAAGGSWHNPPSYPYILSQKVFYMEVVKELTNKKGLWGWKDPRTILTIECYFPYLKNPHFVICFRDIYKIAQSLHRQGAFPIEVSIDLATEYYKRINNFIKTHEYPVLYISIEDLDKNKLKQIKRMKEFIEK